MKPCLHALLLIISLSGLSCSSTKPLTDTSTFQPAKFVAYFKNNLEAGTLPMPAASSYQQTIRPAAIPSFRRSLWAAWKEANAARLATWPSLAQGEARDSLMWDLPTDKQAYFAVFKKGDKPVDGYPLYINLHGGGTLPEATNARGAAFNDSEWKAAKILGARYADSPSLYFIPRMADDRRGRWYHKGEQTEFLRAWQLSVLSGDVNPNKTFIIGISEGGYGSFRMGPFFADYFAGAGPMAGDSHLNEAPLENMRNTPFCISVGEFDNAYGRAAGGHEWKQSLDSASAANPGQFIHLVDIQKGRGHGIDYFKTAPWLRPFVRNPYPDTISFQYYAVHDTVFDRKADTSYSYRKGFAYVRLDGLKASAQPMPDGLLKTGVRDFYLEKRGNTYRITSKERIGQVSGHIGLYLDKVDYDTPLIVFYNGKQVYHKKIRPNVGTMAESLALFGDPDRIFAAKINIPIP